jgi:CNT family concentrative nucleoside transporter
MSQFTGLIGVVVLIGIAVLLSTHRRAISVRVVIAGLSLQFLIAFGFLKFEPVMKPFGWLAAGVTRVISFADAGTVFIFGDQLSNPSGPWGFVFAVKVLPVIIFFASLMAVLYHLGVMQRIVAGVAWVLRKTLGVTGTEALSAAANIFVGQTEAPLIVRPYIAGMTRSQIMAVMTGGFATIAGSVMAAYIMRLGGEDFDSRALFARHLMTASVMSAPAGFVMAKIMMPETETPASEHLQALVSQERPTRNVLDAAASGASDGLRLALNVAAMLVAFVALLAMLNWPLAAISEWNPVANWRAQHGIPVLTLETILGYILTPLAWCMGVAREDCRNFGSLLGQQVIVTEFVAYLDLANHKDAGTMSARSCQIAAYALCGFANLPSIAIQIGGLSALAPERRADFSSIGLRAMVAGALACWMTASIASIFI